MFSCTSNTILKKPDNLIPEDQMVDLITDLLIAKEAKAVKNENLEQSLYNYYEPFAIVYHCLVIHHRLFCQ